MWKKTGSRVLIFMTALIWFAHSLPGGQGIVYCAEPEVSMGIDKDNVLLGDSVILTITVRNGGSIDPPEIASIPDFDVRFRGTRQESFSSFTMIVQGRTVEQKQTGGGYHFDYVLTPQKAGTFTVPSFGVTVNQKTYQTQPFTIQVFDQAEKSEDIFVEVTLDKQEVFLGEKILVTVKWFLNKDVDGYLMNVPWLQGLKNFLITDPKPEEGRRYHRFTVNGNEQVIATKQREFYKGQPYTVITFQKLLTPISVGTYTLEPIFLRADVVTGYERRRSRSIFDDFFDSNLDSFFGFGNSAVTEPFSTRSDPLEITVLEVPTAEKPDSFSGGVGVFDFRMAAKPLRLKVGEPITLTMQVIGAGNIEQVKLPDLPPFENFKSYEPESRVNTAQQGGEIIGEKIFEMVLVPRKEGRFEIPPVRFTFFNPREQDYQTIERGPFAVTVEKSEMEEPVPAAISEEEEKPLARKKQIQFIERDIQYIKTELGPVRTSDGKYYENVFLWAGLYLPPLSLLFGLFSWRHHKDRLKTDIGFARRRFASKNIKKYLDDASQAVSRKNTREFYDALSKGLHQYLADKLNRPVGTIHLSDVAGELKNKGIREEITLKLRSIDDRCHMALFASVSHGPEKLKEDLGQARKIIDQLEKAL